MNTQISFADPGAYKQTGTHVRCPLGTRGTGRSLLSLSSLVVLIWAGLLGPLSTAHASNSTLLLVLHQWGVRIGVDGRALQAAGRQPQCTACATAAQHLATDAAQARQALIAVQPSSPSGARLRAVAIAAFTDVAQAGTDFVQGLHAVAQHQQTVGLQLLKKGAALAKEGGQLLDETVALLGAAGQKPLPASSPGEVPVPLKGSAPAPASRPVPQANAQ